MIEMGWVLAFVRLCERVATRLPGRAPLADLETLAGALELEWLRRRVAACLGRGTRPPVLIGVLAIGWVAVRSRGSA